MSEQWFIDRVPGFSELSEIEREAIAEFSLLWPIFEGQILGSFGSADSICEAVEKWGDEGGFKEDEYLQELTYFSNRYFADGAFTGHFEHLHLRQNDRRDLVRSVIDGTNNVPQDRVAALLIIIMRFRHNLFHGIKWEYNLKGQLENFKNANNVLIKALETHGRLITE